MIEAMDDPAYICSKNFRVEYMNAAMLKRIGKDATGELCYKAIHNLDKKCSWCIHETVMKGVSIKTEVISPRDNKIYNISNSPILHIYGAISKLTIFRDITETKNMEKRLEQAQRMESIGNLAGGIAHDFNNLLFPIMGISEMLLEDLAPDSQEYENVQVILEAGKRGSGLVKQILAFSRQAEHKMIPVRVQYVLNEALKLSRSTIPINIEITQEVQNDCGLVMADPIQLHQIAMNLITNAYHAVGQTYGRIAVKLKTVEICSDDGESSTLETGHYVMLSVSDDGCGIEPAVMDKIFDPYFTTKEKTKGTGLGLSVVYGIVKQHKGDIKVYSEIGNGSMFKVFLPLMKESVDSSFVDQRQTIKMGTERILIVDDEASIVRVEKQMLERLGYAVTDRISSIEALKTFRANPTDFDLVITDMTMPNMTGDQLAKELIAIRSDIPVIICTGFSESINREKAESAGIKGLLMKPVVKSEMAEMVRKSLNEEEINL
jgi:signal transduction histidine kinase/ActR/RegA family two-component response regulator